MADVYFSRIIDRIGWCNPSFSSEDQHFATLESEGSIYTNSYSEKMNALSLCSNITEHLDLGMQVVLYSS